MIDGETGGVTGGVTDGGGDGQKGFATVLILRLLVGSFGSTVLYHMAVSVCCMFSSIPYYLQCYHSIQSHTECSSSMRG